MALTLVTGRVNSGKSGTLYRPVIESALAGAQPVVLFPSRPDALRATEEFAARGVSGVRTTVLDAWIAELWALHGDGRRLVENGAREVLMRRACSSTRISAIAASALTPGFVRTMSAVAERAAGVGAPRPTTPEDHEVVAVLERYEELREAAGLVEPAIAAVELGRRPPALDGPVAVNRFTDLSPAQEAFVSGLASANDVLVALPWEEGHPATEALSPLVERLALAGEHIHVAAERVGSELDTIERDLYRPDELLEPTGAVTFAEAAGEELECALAIDIVAGLIEEGLEPGRIALVFRDATSRVALIEAAAARAGVPVEVDVATGLAETALGRALLALLDVVSGRDPSRERLLAFLHSPYSGVSPDEVERLDTGWRRRRTGSDRRLEEVRRSPAGQTVVLAQKLPGARLDRSNVRIWQSLMDALIVAAEERRGVAHTAGARDCAVHREVLRVVSVLADSVEDGVTEPEVRAVLERVKVATGGQEGSESVVFTEAHRVRARRFDALVLGGLTALEFSPDKPRPVAAEILGRLGLPAGRDERESERLLFYTVSTRARSRLVLLRQGSDAIGQALRPSVFWEEVLDLYRARDGSEAEEHPARVPRIVRPLSAIPADAVTYLPGRREERSSRCGTPWRPVRGKLISEEVRAAFASTEEFSVSELEAYSHCPYRWFVERSVRPREIDAAFEAREAGSAAHETLALFYERWAEQAGGEPARVTPDTLPEALEMVDALLDEVLASAPAPVALAEELAADRVRSWVRLALQDDSLLLPGYTPHAHELSFGVAQDRRFELGGVSLRGRIDRVDVRRDGVVVTDYKSARTVHGHGSFATAGVIQLPVYLAAAAAILGLEPEGAVYRSLSSRSVRGFFRADRVPLVEWSSARDAVDEGMLRDIVAHAAERAAEAADGIRAGRIGPTPDGCPACASCSARATCGGRADA